MAASAGVCCHPSRLAAIRGFVPQDDGGAKGVAMFNRPRRVVTGHNAEGKSVFISDGPTPHMFQRNPGSAIVMELWETGVTPASNRGNDDAIARGFRLPPPKNGSVFRIIEYPPDKERIKALAAERAGPDDGSGWLQAADKSGARHLGFHKTSSVDYAIVLSGEIYAL